MLQDYRFAFADLFLKRAFSLILLASLAFGLYVFAAVPLLAWHETHDRNDVQAAVIVMTLWIATALVYPFLHKFAVWLVDKVILRRVNYEFLQIEIAQIVEKQNDKNEILDKVCEKLKIALTAKKANWQELEDKETEKQNININSNNTGIIIPTVENPFYIVNLKNFSGGRKLLSDELQMLENIALITARRIDNLRVTNERHAQELQTKEISKLATEAQLKALRAQINPHFLFNALTTIGYLIQTAPDKAFSTLMKLTQLLRGILRSTGEFTTLGEEINLIENYLEIEQARFEERLTVEIEVPKDLRKIKIPALILQPLVENSIKHGISKNKFGGKVQISANLESKNNSAFLKLIVIDSGAGGSLAELPETSRTGLGLNNIEQRLSSYYGKLASLKFESKNGNGTSAEIILPISDGNLTLSELQKRKEI